jgi:hypothetical protein
VGKDEGKGPLGDQIVNGRMIMMMMIIIVIIIIIILSI